MEGSCHIYFLDDFNFFLLIWSVFLLYFSHMSGYCLPWFSQPIILPNLALWIRSTARSKSMMQKCWVWSLLLSKTMIEVLYGQNIALCFSTIRSLLSSFGYKWTNIWDFWLDQSDFRTKALGFYIGLEMSWTITRLTFESCCRFGLSGSIQLLWNMLHNLNHLQHYYQL